jgi:hypothetical protein
MIPEKWYREIEREARQAEKRNCRILHPMKEQPVEKNRLSYIWNMFPCLFRDDLSIGCPFIFDELE